MSSKAADNPLNKKQNIPPCAAKVPSLKQRRHFAHRHLTCLTDIRVHRRHRRDNPRSRDRQCRMRPSNAAGRYFPPEHCAWQQPDFSAAAIGYPVYRPTPPFVFIRRTAPSNAQRISIFAIFEGKLLTRREMYGKIPTVAAALFAVVCGCSSMVEPQPSKLVVWVRFPSPAPYAIQAPVAQLDRASAF